MRSWFLWLLEIVEVGKGLAEVVFILPIQCYLESLPGEENDEYVVNKIRRRVFHGFAVIELIGSFILARRKTAS